MSYDHHDPDSSPEHDIARRERIYDDMKERKVKPLPKYTKFPGRKGGAQLKHEVAKKMHTISGHSQWLTQQVKKDNPAYYAEERRALRARRKK